MPIPLHSTLSPDDCHPPKAVTFTGDSAAYVPSVSGVLVLKNDVTPWELYATTGVVAGALQLVGAVGGGGGSSIQFVRSNSSPSSPPAYDGTSGISFYVYTYTDYGSPRAALFFGTDTTGVNFTNGWEQLQNF